MLCAGGLWSAPTGSASFYRGRSEGQQPHTGPSIRTRERRLADVLEHGDRFLRTAAVTSDYDLAAVIDTSHFFYERTYMSMADYANRTNYWTESDERRPGCAAPADVCERSAHGSAREVHHDAFPDPAGW